MKKISIVIVSYMSDVVLKDCLLSIQSISDVPKKDFEVVIVDNYAKSELDKLIEEIREFVDFHIEYVKNSKNGGFGQGNNLGANHANGEVILFLNPDTILIESVLKETFEYAKENYIVGYRLVDSDLYPNNSYSFFPEWWCLSPLFLVIKRYFFLLPNRISMLNKMIWPWGAAFAVSKSTFLKAGGFDERIFLCNEEPDLLRRISERKIKILNKRIVHLEGHGDIVSESRYLEYLKSTKYYFQKYNLDAGLFWKYISITAWVKSQLDKSDESKYNLLEALKKFKEMTNF